MQEWLHQRTVDLGALVVRRIDRLLAWGSEIGNPAFFDPDTFPWVDRLESDWRTIRGEVDRILEHRDAIPAFHEISPYQKKISDEKWKTFFLYAYGYKADGNCARCPETTRIVDSIPGMKTAFFSILSPGKHIPAHRGPYKGLVRCHLGLLVPEPRAGCRIRVDDEYASWEEGKVMLFDDTYEHEVWNDTEGTRVVLFLDILRPLKQPARAVNGALLRLIGASPYIQDGVENYKRWEKKFDQMSH